MRNILNKFGIPIAIIIIFAAGIYAWRSTHKGAGNLGNISLGFFVDEVTSEESVHRLSEIPPLPGKDGNPTVVRAMKYSCDAGANPKTIYLLKYTPEALTDLQTLPVDDPRRPTVFFSGQLVRSPEAGAKWVPLQSPEGEEVIALPECPNGKPIVMVSPN